MTPLTFRQQCALVLLEKYADKMFDERFKQEARDSSLEVEQLLVAYIENVANEMCRAYE